ncbi:hypothetical protein [Mycobacterium sp.]|uniref:hypothetical protein n=1 Tax=Mycobacterium sp. TaxID=1785 RepID=UPI0025F94E0F|nr:hypothetical protein [Mycobacterium sp.]
MAFKLTYSDGQSTDYDDSTKWEVDDGVVKLGRDEGDWTVYISPSHWATLELGTGSDGDKKSDEDKKSDKNEKSDDDKKSDKDKKSDVD